MTEEVAFSLGTSAGDTACGFSAASDQAVSVHNHPPLPGEGRGCGGEGRASAGHCAVWAAVPASVELTVCRGAETLPGRGLLFRRMGSSCLGTAVLRPHLSEGGWGGAPAGTAGAAVPWHWPGGRVGHQPARVLGSDGEMSALTGGVRSDLIPVGVKQVMIWSDLQ